MIRLLLPILVLASLFSGCAAREEMSYSNLAEDVYTDLMELSDALEENASDEEIASRLRLLMEKSYLLLDLAEDFDDLMSRWRVLERRAMRRLGHADDEIPADADSYFRERGYEVGANPPASDRINTADTAANAEVRRLLENHRAAFDELDNTLRDNQEADAGAEGEGESDENPE